MHKKPELEPNPTSWIGRKSVVRSICRRSDIDIIFFVRVNRRSPSILQDLSA